VNNWPLLRPARHHAIGRTSKVHKAVERVALGEYKRKHGERAYKRGELLGFELDRVNLHDLLKRALHCLDKL
jgi:hypothetical protein